MVATTLPETSDAQSHWDALAAKARWQNRAKNISLFAFLIAVSVPIIVPYFWLVTLAFSASLGGTDTEVLWASIFILVPALIVLWAWAAIANSRQNAVIGCGVISIATAVIYAILIGDKLHLNGFRFLVDPNFNTQNESIVGAQNNPGFSVATFPSVWRAAGNSLFVAGAQTLIVTMVGSLAGYYISRFKFPLRASMLRSMLVLHAFPTMTLIVPLFVVLWFIGLLDSLWGVMFVLVGIELPFAVFIMKGFFDAVPWEVEMSALADGATRRQAFVKVVLPQVTNGMIAVAVFSFIRGWEEYIFMLTFLIKNSNWTMSLYLFFITEENSLGIDFGLVSAVSVFYVIPSLVLYTVAQKYLLQMSVAGVKG